MSPVQFASNCPHLFRQMTHLQQNVDSETMPRSALPNLDRPTRPRRTMRTHSRHRVSKRKTIEWIFGASKTEPATFSRRVLNNVYGIWHHRWRLQVKSISQPNPIVDNFIGTHTHAHHVSANQTAKTCQQHNNSLAQRACRNADMPGTI